MSKVEKYHPCELLEHFPGKKLNKLSRSQTGIICDVVQLIRAHQRLR